MTADPFAYMAAILVKGDGFDSVMPERERSQAARVRNILRRGPCRTKTIADELGVTQARVSALMKWDRIHSRVHFSDGFWSLVEDAEREHREKVREAILLLRRHGYTVTAADAARQ